MPAAGANSLRYETGAGPYGSNVTIASYENVAQQVPPYQADSGFSNPPYSGGTAHTTNITPAAGAGMLVDVFGIEGTGGTIDAGASQTQRELTVGGSPYTQTSDKVFSSNAANSMSQEPQSTHDSFAHLVAELAEAGGGAQIPNAIAHGANF